MENRTRAECLIEIKRDEQMKLFNALDVIREYEDGDSVSLKRRIRKRIEELDEGIEELKAK